MVCAAAAVVVSCGAFGADGDDDDDAPAPAKADGGSAPDRATPSDATSDDVASPSDAGPDAAEPGPASCDEILIRNLKPEEGDTCIGNKTLLSVPGGGEPVGLPFVNIGTGVCGAVQAGKKDSFQVPHLAGQCITIEFVPSSDKAKLTLAKGLTGTFPSGGTYTGGARRVVASMPLTTLTLDLEITSPDATTYTLAVF
ncbi:MAG: hypothetical protein U0270_34165 [Labilithrix sp.]